MRYSVLIVDDEPNARDYLVGLVSKHNALELAGICATGNEAIAFCQTLQPDIIFLDIQMPGKNGIETAQSLMAKDKTSTIIFSTAFDQYAIQAFEVEAIGYLLKPFSSEQFKNTVERAIAMKETAKKADFDKRMSLLFERYDQESPVIISEFIVYEKGLEIQVPTDIIEYLISDSEYVALHTESRKYLKRLALELLARQLPPSFIRIHRSIIINKQHVIKWTYLNNGTYSFHYNHGVILKSSRSYQQAIRGTLSSES